MDRLGSAIANDKTCKITLIIAYAGGIPGNLVMNAETRGFTRGPTGWSAYQSQSTSHNGGTQRMSFSGPVAGTYIVQNPMDFNGLKKETATIVVQLRIGLSEGEEESGIITLDSWDITLVP